MKKRILKRSLPFALSLSMVVSPLANVSLVAHAEGEEKVYLEENFDSYEVQTIIQSGNTKTAPDPVPLGNITYKAGSRDGGGALCYAYIKEEAEDAADKYLNISENKYASSNRGISYEFNYETALPTVSTMTDTILELSMDLTSDYQFTLSGFGIMPVLTEGGNVRAIIDNANSKQYLIITDDEGKLVSSTIEALTATGFTGADFCNYYPNDNFSLNVASIDNIKVVEKSTDVGLVTVTVTSGGEALADTTVTIDGATFTTDANGQAVVALPNGTYSVEATKSGYEATQGMGDNAIVEVTVASESEAVEMTLAKQSYAKEPSSVTISGGQVYVVAPADEDTASASAFALTVIDQKDAEMVADEYDVEWDVYRADTKEKDENVTIDENGVVTVSKDFSTANDLALFTVSAKVSANDVTASGESTIYIANSDVLSFTSANFAFSGGGRTTSIDWDDVTLPDLSSVTVEMDVTEAPVSKNGHITLAMVTDGGRAFGIQTQGDSETYAWTDWTGTTSKSGVLMMNQYDDYEAYTESGLVADSIGTVKVTFIVDKTNSTVTAISGATEAEALATTMSLNSLNSMQYGKYDGSAGAGTIKTVLVKELDEITAMAVGLDKTELTLDKDATATLTANVVPSAAVDKTVTWSSDNEEVATVVDGVVTAVAAGTANITATTESGLKETCAVTVEVAATGVTLDKTEATLQPEETVTLTATVAPEDAKDKTVTWSSDDEEVATVVDGVVTAVAVGTATITATTANGKTAECVVTVEVVATGVTLDKTEATVEKGETVTLTATVAPEDATDKTVTWSSDDEEVATVVDGVVTAVSGGTATITATTANGKSAECAVTVTVSISEVTLDKEEVTLNVEETATLVATVAPADTTMDKTVTWSSDDEEVATVENGVVTAVAAGTATITATTVNDKTAECVVTVEVAATGVTLDKTEATVEKGETVTLTATVAPEDATDKTVTWSSDDEEVATVVDGVVTAVSGGTATITATTANGKSAECEVTVTVTITGVSLNTEALTLNEEDTATLVATVLPADTTMDKTVTWSSSAEEVATVENGVVTAVAEGIATITVTTVNDKTATCAVTVSKDAVLATEVTLDKTEATVEKGETVTLTATVAPEDATDKTVTWSTSDEEVATVANGVVTAVSGGTATITATTANGKSAECVVTVTVAVTEVTLDKTEATVTEGETITLTATVAPEDATSKTVTWTTSDAEVATVENGVVTAVAAGTATITAKAGDKTATCVVTVEKAPVAVSGVTLDKTEATVTEGETVTLTATVAPEDATDKTVTWTTSDAEVATVENGVVTAVAAGTATITAKAGDKTATCVVTVEKAPIAVSGVNLDKTEATVTEGETVTLTATVAPEDATDKTVTWTTSDAKVATVENGVVTAVAAGTATITAKAGDKTATCTVTVEKKVVPATGVTLDKNELTVVEGKTATLTATVAPADATEKDVAWTTSDAEVATVANGVVTAVAPGTATITATVGEFTATCTVNVEEFVPNTFGEAELVVKAFDTTSADNVAIGESGYKITTTANGNYNNAVVINNASNNKDTFGYWPYYDLPEAGHYLFLGAGGNGGVVEMTLTLPQTLHAGSTMKITFAKPVGTNDEANNKIRGNANNDNTFTVGSKTFDLKNDYEFTQWYTETIDIDSTVSEITFSFASWSSIAITKIELTAAPDVVATDVTLDKEEVTLTAGETATLVATVAPENTTNKAVTWSSSDETVATVVDGVVTAVAAGTATITVTTANDLTATCTVTVERAAQLLDVEEGWKLTAAQYVFDKGLMNGVDTDENGDVYFSPDTQLKREMLAQILYAAEDKPEFTTDKTFSDLAEGGWYVNAVLWAAENNIVSGIGEGMFGVDQNITREQLALMLYKYAELKGYDVTATMELDEFVDSDAVNTWSATAMKWAVANGVMSGKPVDGGTALAPQGEATRVECAAMLRSFMLKFVDVQTEAE